MTLEPKLEMNELEKYGWQTTFADAFERYQEAGFSTGRISVENREQYFVLTPTGEYAAAVTGKLLYMVDSPSDLPKVGDWVVISLFEKERKAIIHDILPRQTKFSRKVANKKVEEQIIATNIDYIFVVQSLDNNFNLNRLERYLVMIREGGAEPVVVLNKIDLCADPEEKCRQVSALAGDVTILPTSATTEEGLAALRAHLRPGLTYALVGSSGVGKSSLINRLVGAEILKTGEVREKDAKGSHTTTRRELIVLPNGALLIDTPGMREMQLWDATQGVDDTFSEILQLAANCKFPDCTHTKEKGCAVLQAVETGELSQDRYENYVKLAKEMAYLDRKRDQKSFLASKRKEKEFHRARKRYLQTQYPKK